MKTSGLIILIVSLATAFFNVSALAQASTIFVCRPVEFAELRALSKFDLQSLYCANKRNEEANFKMWNLQMDFALESARLGFFRDSQKNQNDAAQYMEYRDACKRENDRLLRVIRMEDVTATPECK